MKIIDLSVEKLNMFIAGQAHTPFLQSAAWGEFQAQEGYPVYRWGLEKDGQLVLALQFFQKNLGGGQSYFYAPRVSADQAGPNELEFLLERLKDEAARVGATFLRFDPTDSWPMPDFTSRFRRSIDVQPSRTLLLDLSASEAELLAAMHQKTRYNIRLAAKKGVTIKKVGMDRFEEFWGLMEETVTRDEFRLHSKDYYRSMLAPDQGLLGLYFADHDQHLLAANIMAQFGDTMTYVHGASSNQYRNLMAPFLLQWELIKTAKQAGCRYYDFYGINSDKWPGVTRFKKGFGGQEIDYPGTFDAVFQPTKYTLYKTLRTLRRWF